MKTSDLSAFIGVHLRLNQVFQQSAKNRELISEIAY